MSIEQVYLKRDITPLIQFLKLRDEPVDITTHDHILSFSFYGIYEVDRLRLHCQPVDHSKPMIIRIFTSSTLLHEVFDEIDTYIRDHHHTRFPSVHDVLFKTFKPNKDSFMEQTLFTHLKALGNPLHLVYAKHNVIFKIDPEAQNITYTVDYNGDASKTYTFDKEGCLSSLASDLSDATRRATDEDGLYTCGNIVRIHDSLCDIVKAGPNHVMDSDFKAVIDGVVLAMNANESKALTMEYDDITVYITYSDMMLHVSVRVPGEYCNTKHFGITSDIYEVSDYISEQLHNVDSLALVPNKALVLDTLEMLIH